MQQKKENAECRCANAQSKRSLRLCLVCAFYVHVLAQNAFQPFFLLSAVKADFFNREQCICALFTNPQISLFINFFIKNGSHDTIHTFKNYFATVFFSFQVSVVSKQTLTSPLKPGAFNLLIFCASSVYNLI